MLASLGALWCAGVDLDGTALRPPDARKVPLPGHPWYRRRYWIDPPAPGTVTPAPGGRIPAGADPEPTGRAKPAGPAGAGVPRPALPNPYVPPETDRQRQLVALCGAVLGYTGIGLDDDVFALGADSLTAFRLVQRTRAELGAAPPLREFLEDPRVRNLEREPEPTPEERT